MSPNKRNVLVGVTVLGGLVGLGGLLLRFGGSTVNFLKGGHQLQIQFRSDRSDGLAEGAQVLYRGFPVGRVTGIERDRNRRDILIETEIEDDPPLPGNVTGNIRTVSLVSGIAALSLDVTGGATAVPEGNLSDHKELPAVYVGADLIPPEFTAEIRTAGEVIKGINGYVNDPNIAGNFRSSLENLKHITDSVQHTAVNVQDFSDHLKDNSIQITATLTHTDATVRAAQTDVEHLSRQIDDRMLQLDKSLDAVQSIVVKVNSGKGTAGLLVNDPKLYESLVDNSRDLNITVNDLKRLIEQWEQEGVSLKLK
jgi:phospholipid/cholesterol/gamma-HCH transport system substrate-binding protein